MAAITGTGKDFIIGKNQVIVLPTIGKEKRVDYSDIESISFRLGTWKDLGTISVTDKFGEEYIVNFRSVQNDNCKAIIKMLQNQIPNIKFNRLEPPKKNGVLTIDKELQRASNPEEIDLALKKAVLLEQQKANELQEKQYRSQAKCPKCGSTSLQAQKKGYGLVKGGLGALAGAVSVGIVGAAVGTGVGNIGRKKVWVTCLNCGHRFKL